jgi:hypothetical protein
MCELYSYYTAISQVYRSCANTEWYLLSGQATAMPRFSFQAWACSLVNNDVEVPELLPCCCRAASEKKLQSALPTSAAGMSQCNH